MGWDCAAAVGWVGAAAGAEGWAVLGAAAGLAAVGVAGAAAG